jgi:hypothetical protein
MHRALFRSRKATMTSPASACAANQPTRTLLAKLLSYVRAWTAALADAYAMARMYEQRRRLCDAELRRRGLSRATLARDLWRKCEQWHDRRRADD